MSLCGQSGLLKYLLTKELRFSCWIGYPSSGSAHGGPETSRPDSYLRGLGAGVDATSFKDTELAQEGLRGRVLLVDDGSKTPYQSKLEGLVL